MRKIMFNDRYGLTAATLRGDKTMTRRIVKCPKKYQGVEDIELEFHRRWGQDIFYDCVVVDANGHELGQLVLPYEVGDVVAIAQSYKDVGVEPSTIVKMIDEGQNMFTPVPAIESAGWENKMYVRADLMPNQIRITDLWFEKLRDISSEDCLREGIEARVTGCHTFYYIHGEERPYNFPKQAFAALIDRISGRGTWESNPWVIAYTYELVKED